MTIIDEIKKAISEKKIIIGENSVKKALKNDEIKTIVISNNAPQILFKEIESLSKINKINFEKIDKDNIQLGLTCRKPFSVSILAIKK